MKASRDRPILLLVGLALAAGTLQFLYHYLDDLSRGVNGTFATRFIEEWTGTLTFFALIRSCSNSAGGCHGAASAGREPSRSLSSPASYSPSRTRR